MKKRQTYTFQIHLQPNSYLCTGKRKPGNSQLPFQVVLVLREAGSSQRGRGLTQVAHKVIAEVEGHGVFIGVKPPADGEQEEMNRHTSSLSGTVQSILSHHCGASIMTQKSKGKDLPRYSTSEKQRRKERENN